MDVDTFVRQLADVAPSPSELLKCGLVGKQADDFVKSFFGVKRSTPSPDVRGLDDLDGLRNWDLSKIEIGMVRFPNPPVERSGTVCIGCVEVDPMVILPDNGEVVVHELGTQEHLLWPVAKNGTNMLDALLIAARFLEKTGMGLIDFRNSGNAEPVALECAAAAGGDKYVDFYKMLLGAE